MSLYKKAKSRRYPPETIIDTDYADDLGLLTFKPTQSESLLYSLGQAAGRIGLYVNVNKTEFMCFKQERVISTFSGKPLKLVDKSTDLGSNISSNSDVNICLAKALTAIDRLSIYITV